jgi:hypothetical protein
MTPFRTSWKVVRCSQCGRNLYPDVDTPEPYICGQCHLMAESPIPVHRPTPSTAGMKAGTR